MLLHFLLTYRIMNLLKSMTREEVPEIDGVVCVQVFSYNEEEYIGRCLRSILDQKVVREFPDRFRLQVFDSSTDSTPMIARSYGFEVIRLPRGKLYARNYSVVNYPECHIHIHVDADTFFPDNWLGNVLSHFKDPNVVAVTTPRIYTNFLGVIQLAFYGLFNLVDRVFGSNSAIRHDVFMKNLFNLEYDGSKDMVLEEEYWFLKRLERHGEVVFELTPAFTRPSTLKYVF